MDSFDPDQNTDTEPDREKKNLLTHPEQRLTSPLEQASGIAMGLLREDGWFAATLFLLLLAIPRVVLEQNTLLPLPLSYQSLLVAICDTVFLVVVCQRWIDRLRIKTPRINLTSLTSCIVLGISVWIPHKLLLVAFGPSAQSLSLVLFSLVLLIPTVKIYFDYFFYFVPVLFFGTGRAQSLRDGRSLGDRVDRAALKVCIAPYLAASLLGAIAITPSPDQRELYVIWLKFGLTGTFWLLTTYMSLALAFVMITEEERGQAGFDPERIARLFSLEKRLPGWIKRSMRPRAAWMMLFIAILISVANISRAANLAPTPTISVNQIVIDKNSLEIELLLRDDTHHFRGFVPLFFTLAGEDRGNTIASPAFPIEVILNDTRDPLAASRIPESEVDPVLRVRFFTARDAAGLRELKDLHLWYMNSRIAHLDMKNATLVAPVKAHSSHPAESAQ